MPARRTDQPAYQLHRASGLAFVKFRGHKPTYLGKHGTPESLEAYYREIAEWHARGKATAPPPAAPPDRGPSVFELVAAFLKWTETRYVKNGKPTSEVRSFRTALAPVVALYSRTRAADFGPLALTACRQRLIDAGICRKRINAHVGRIRRAFKWAASRQLVAPAVWQALQSVEGLRPGQTVAPDPEPVKAVPDDLVAATRPFLTPQLAAMVDFQLLTGARPGEVCRLTTGQIERTGATWIYRPRSHKTEHRGKNRFIAIGPKAQAIIRPFLRADPDAPLFQPAESREWHLSQRRANRKTPRTPSQKRRRRKRKPDRAPGRLYSVLVYGQSIKRACRRAKIDEWTPNQLRHAAATKIRAAFGIEAARVILGHSSAVTSEIYAEIDRSRADQIISELG